MNRTHSRHALLAVLSATVLFLAGCSTDGVSMQRSTGTTVTDGEGTVRLLVTDKPDQTVMDARPLGEYAGDFHILHTDNMQAGLDRLQHP